MPMRVHGTPGTNEAGMQWYDWQMRWPSLLTRRHDAASVLADGDSVLCSFSFL
jgi:hypothetical protein